MFNPLMPNALTHHAFFSEKGIFTIVGSDIYGNYDFKNLLTKEYHTWHRNDIKLWLNKKLIHIVEQSLEMTWFLASPRDYKLFHESLLGQMKNNQL